MGALPSFKGTEAAERVADVLMAFSRGDRSLGVSTIARELSLSKAVVHRILQSLVSRDLVRYSLDRREYSLGPSASVLGARALRQLDVRVAARDELIRLRDETRETTTLSLLVIDRRAYVEQFEGPQEVKMTVELGRLYPLHAGASSRVILANLAAIDLEHVLEAGLESLTDNTVVDVGELERNLADIRRDGFAASAGERQSGAASVAAPIFGSSGRVVGSISVCGPSNRFDQAAVSRLGPLVVLAARRISVRLEQRHRAGA